MCPPRQRPPHTPLTKTACSTQQHRFHLPQQHPRQPDHHIEDRFRKCPAPRITPWRSDPGCMLSLRQRWSTRCRLHEPARTVFLFFFFFFSFLPTRPSDICFCGIYPLICTYTQPRFLVTGHTVSYHPFNFPSYICPLGGILTFFFFFSNFLCDLLIPMSHRTWRLRSFGGNWVPRLLDECYRSEESFLRGEGF